MQALPHQLGHAPSVHDKRIAAVKVHRRSAAARTTQVELRVYWAEPSRWQIFTEFNLAPSAARRTAGTRGPRREFLRKLIFPLRCSVARSGVREKCPWFRPMSPPFN